MTAQEIADLDETDTIAAFERWQSWRQEWALREIEERLGREAEGARESMALSGVRRATSAPAFLLRRVLRVFIHGA